MNTKKEILIRLDKYIDNLSKFRDVIEKQLENVTENEEFEFNWVEDCMDGFEIDYILYTGGMELLRRKKQFKKTTKLEPIIVNGETLYRKIETIKDNGYSKWEKVLFE